MTATHFSVEAVGGGSLGTAFVSEGYAEILWHKARKVETLECSKLEQLRTAVPGDPDVTTILYFGSAPGKRGPRVDCVFHAISTLETRAADGWDAQAELKQRLRALAYSD